MTAARRTQPSRPARTARWRGLSSLGLVVLLVLAIVAPSIPAGAAPEPDPLAAKRREAAQVAAELERLEEAADVAVERFLQARLAADELAVDVDTARRAAEAGARALGEAEAASTAAIQRAYVRGAEVGVFARTMAVLSAGPDRKLSTNGKVYGELAIGLTTDVVDRLRSAREDASRHQAELERRLAEQERAVAEQAASREAAEAAVAEQQARAQRVQGELAELVRQEQARRAAEEERRAREEAARRAAAEAEARRAAEQAAAARRASAATSTTSPSSTAPARPTTTAARSSSGTPAPTSSPSSPSSSAPAATTPPTTSAPVSAPPARAGAATAVAAAQSQLGVPYRYAASEPGVGFDCSGLTMWAWAQAGVRLPHSSAMQFSSLTPVPLDHIQPGDLVAFGTPVHHIGIYIGNGQMIHAPQTGRDVMVASIYRRDLRGAVRP